MKYMFTAILFGLSFVYSNAQTEPFRTVENVTLDENLSEQNLIIRNARVSKKISISVSDTLKISDSELSDGIITAKVCILENCTISCTKKDSLAILEKLILKNCSFPKTDSLHIPFVSAPTIYINDYSTIESAYIECNNLIINDTLELTGKLGVKEIHNDCIINGTIINTDNENIKLHGDLVNNANETCTGLNLVVCGTDNSIQGDIAFKRLKLEGNASYTTYDKISIDDFSGTGTLIQAENAYTIINASDTPKIIASALGNTLEYTRDGIQSLNTNECYNLILSKKRNSQIQLKQDCVIKNKLIITQNCFLNCKTFNLTFNNLEVTKFKRDRGLIPNEGHIFIPELPTNESLWLPLFTSEQTYAGITITNLDENHTDFYIGSILPFVTETGLATDKHIIYEFVENTWNFSSSIEKAEITFEWDSSKQLPEFNSEDCSVYHSDGTSWAIQDSFSPEYEKITTTHALNGYFAIANKLILLPISLEYFYIGNKNGIKIINWKSTNSDTFYLEKSFDGIHFFTLAKIPFQTSHTYSFTDYSPSPTALSYYRLMQIDKNNTVDYSEILCTSDNTPLISITGTEISTTIQPPYSLILTDLIGKIIQKTENAPLQLTSKGTYIIIIKTPRNTFQQKISL